MSDPLRCFDLFCGAGGSSRGAAMAGCLPVGGLDCWDLAIETFGLNFPSAKRYQARADAVSPSRVLEMVGPVELLLASPECTNHSVAKGNAPRCEVSRSTAYEVIRFASVLRPRWVVVENVTDMLRWGRFGDWHDQLRELGYKTIVATLDANDHGVAQARRRLFVVGDSAIQPTLPPKRRGRKKTVAGVLGWMEPAESPWPFSPLRKRGRARATVQRANRAIRELGAEQPFIMVYYGSDGAGGFQTLDRPLRTVTTLDRFAWVRPNCMGYEMRMLQPPELAAASGFPNDHLWPETSRRNRIRLIGNAVCPPVMADIVQHLIS